MKKPRVYISGRMTGLPDFNYPAFNAAAAAWRAKGWDVSNPAEEFDGEQGLPYPVYVIQDIKRIQECDAIAMLPGWDDEGARGSVWERMIAVMIYKLPVFNADEPDTPAVLLQRKVVLNPEERSILDEAEEIVNGARQAAYGHPLDDFTKTAKMWSGLFGVEITAEQVALGMMAVKMSRLLNTPNHRDSMVDIAGYAKTYQMVTEERKRRG